MVFDRFISTGHLPDSERTQALLDEALESFRFDEEGVVSSVYPALASVDPDRFGLAVTNVHGVVFTAGDAHEPFTIMSVAKPFVFALVAQDLGVAAARAAIGVNATGRSFNSAEAIIATEDGRTNPMVNPGAIATVSYAPGRSTDQQWEWLLGGLSQFAGHELTLDHPTLKSALATNHINRELARLLHEAGALATDADSAIENYTRQSCLLVTAVDLAVMGATLADGGVNPLTGERVVDELTARCALAVMATAGLYETSGEWLYDVGLPGKSGIGGGIVTVSPGKGALGTYSPRLDPAGNSVRGQHAAAMLSRGLGLDLFAAEAVLPQL